MARKTPILAAALASAGSLVLSAPAANAQVETGPWSSYSPGFSVQQQGCGTVSGLTFSLSCTSTSGVQRAERRYDTYCGGVRQFQGTFRINSMTGDRLSLKQTFGPSDADFMLAVDSGRRLYSVRNGGATISPAGTAPNGRSVTVNTVHSGSTHRIYINGSQRLSYAGLSGCHYDKFGAYRTDSGRGAISVTWSNVRFWQR
ncbi:hypothetical protein LWC34_07590 [Kibdelosporangium philippinense]|uniref:Polysaccharide lyase family 7 protein n=1 Tax=Kibdelosporangium philippinense TaxID=211113 RepID=A0ABS8Z438_9PSEU|nr:hypothetical protein [Kibdelosporangium philippinense]MCE7002693.1 hypothetical protein [Kibdelosporangium philippinense]